MKTSRFALALLSVSLFLTSCKKMQENSLESPQRAAEFKSFIQNNRFQVKAFYADQPIDYIDDDAEVRSETDLFRYASPWIKDDYNVFDESTQQVTITQNEVKIPEIPEDVFTRTYTIGYDNNGVYFDFLNYEYEPLRYRLLEFNDNYFVVYVNWKNGVRLYTRFEVVRT
jgi:hypothetical protein